MTSFIQQDTFLFGSSDARTALAQKECAKLLVISDSHGSALVINTILRQFGADCDALCFCGDGAQDVLTVFEEAAAQKHGLNRTHIPPVAAIVRGNGDTGTAWFCPDGGASSTDRTPVTEVHIPNELVLTVAQKRLLITHGHRYDVYYSSRLLYEAAEQQQAEIVFFGHTHIANVQESAAVTLLNPGSCSRPRGGQPHTFALVTIDGSKAGSSAIRYEYYQISGCGSSISFEPYAPRTGEFNLLW